MPAAPVGIPESFEDHVALLFDLLALAYETDQTRVFTFMMSREFSQRTYPDLGVTEPHHAVSHTRNKPAMIATHVKVNTYHMQFFARFLERLRTTPDGDGSLLDHSHDPVRRRHGRRQRPRADSVTDRRRWKRRSRAAVTSSRGRRHRCRTCCWRLRQRFGVDASEVRNRRRGDQL